jgi:hypothetical protein
MELGEWVKTNVDYGKRLVGSGIDGARTGQEEFFNGEPFGPFVSDSMKASIAPAAIGACVGALAAYPFYRKKSSTAQITMAYGLLGCVVGLTAGLAWKSRHLSASVASGAFKEMGKVRDEKWLTKNPINYA